MKNRQKTFILYQFNEFQNDFDYVMEYNNLEELKKDNNIKLKNERSIYHFVKNSIDDTINLLNDKYIIIKEYNEI